MPYIIGRAIIGQTTRASTVPTSTEYEYIDSRFKSPISRTHIMSVEGCKANDIPLFWIDKQRGDGTHWIVARHDKQHYMARTMGKSYPEPMPILESGRNQHE